MRQHTIQTLEYSRIKSELKQRVLSDYGRKAVDEIAFYLHKEELNYQLDLVEEMRQILYLEKLPPVLLHNIDKELRTSRLRDSMLTARELRRVINTLSSLRKLRSHTLSGAKAGSRLKELAQRIPTFVKIEETIQQAITSEGKLREDASPELLELAARIQNLKQKLEKQLNGYLRSSANKNIIQEMIITQREDRYVVPIKKDQKGKVDGIILDISSSGETLFIEPAFIIDANNELIRIIRSYQKEEQRILRKLTALINTYWEEIHQSLLYLGEMELIIAKSLLANDIHATRPVINNQGVFHLKQARHPFIGKKVVPVDIILGEDYSILIITGPNTGGKTVTLKTLGLLTLMAMSGLHIPAREDSVVSIVDNIFTDIGDEQSIEQNLSTFSAHIQRISQILTQSTQNSLVLIDELGAGTDPKEGSALGVAILERLTDLQPKVLVTSHFEAIKNYALTHENAQTATCEFDLESLAPTYRLIYGLSGSSFALKIARRLGMDAKLINRAKNFHYKSLGKREHIERKLSKEKDKYIKLLKELEQREKELNSFEQALNEKEWKLKQEQKKLTKEYLQELLADYNEKRKVLDSFLKEVQSNTMDRESIKEEYKEVETLRAELKNQIEGIEEQIVLPPYKEEETRDLSHLPIEEGDTVYITGLSKEGVIQSLNPKRKEATVQVGGIKFITKSSELLLKKKKQEQTTENLETKASIKMELDNEVPGFEIMVIGLRADEAIERSKRYIEELYMNGMEKGRIIHGKGEGILRTQIEQMLREHPYVQSFHYASEQEGGFGTTEVFIK